MAQDEKAAVNIRRSKKTAELFDLASEIGRPETDFFIEAGRAILEMVETGSDEVPTLVRAIRALRERGISFSSKKAMPTAMRGMSLLGV